MSAFLPLQLAAVLLQPPAAIVHVRLIDGRGGPPIENATVVVREGRIAAVGPAAEVKVPAGARVIEGRGMSLLPGLADMHTHLGGGWDGESADYLGYRLTMGALLYSGVTTVLDPGDITSYVKQLRDEIRGGRLAGPRIYYTGLVLDGPKPVWADISGAIATPDQAAHFVRQMKQADATFIKAYGGLSTEMVKAVVDAATKDSIRVLADLWQRNGSLADAKTGVAAFAHAATLPMTDEAVLYLADHGTATITTLAVYESFARRRFQDLSFLDQPLLRDVLTPTYQRQIRAHGSPSGAGLDTARINRIARGLGTAQSNVKRMFDAGVLLVAGTDAPYPGDYYGEGLHRELELLVEAGLAPLDVISLATRNAARLVRAESEWGTVEPGKVADLLLVRGNPAVRIADTRRVVMVMQGGRIVDRAALRYDPRRDVDRPPVVLRNH
ncbi:MAG: amidohydrolase family protein [Gemmatimonadales bacterium]|nr:amidohydrolase family protein [Gemmatimonadales bacterium]